MSDKQKLKMTLEFVALGLIALAALNGGGFLRIAMICSWALIILFIISAFTTDDAVIQKIVTSRIEKGFSHEPVFLPIAQMIAPIFAMAWIGNMWTAAFLVVGAVGAAGIGVKVNEGLDARGIKS